MAVDLDALDNDYDLLLAFPLIEENILATAKWFESINPIGGVVDGVKRWSTSGYVERYDGSTSSFVPLEWSKIVFATSFGIVDDSNIGLTISLDGSNQTLLDAANGLLLRVNGTDVIKAYSSGLAGVNTASPAYAWDVTGDINFTGTLYQNGSAVSLVTQTYVDTADATLQTQINSLTATDTSLQTQITSLVGVDTSLQTQISTLTSVIAQTSANFRGEWSSATTYQQYDQVLRNGVRYYSLTSSNLNNDPATSSANWDLFTETVTVSQVNAATTSGIDIRDVSGNLGIKIANGGKVGIGTSSPGGKFHVRGDNDNSSTTFRLESSHYANLQLGSDYNNDSSASSPHITFHTNGDYTTPKGSVGWNEANDVIRISHDIISATTGISIDSSNRVGIGTSDPASPLHVVGTNSGDDLIALNLTNKSTDNGTATAIRFTNSTTEDLLGGEIAVEKQSDTSNDLRINLKNADSTPTFPRVLTIDGSTGNVGIGTSSPYSSLTVRGTGNLINLDLNSTTTGSNSSIVWNGSTSDSTPNYSVAITGYREGTGAAGALGFKTRNGTSGNLEERMIIDSTGNVGIGTSSPSGKLSLNDTTSNTSLTLQSNNASRWWITADGTTTTPYNNVLKIGGTGVSEASQGAINIGGSGNVGIGTSSPKGKLDVSGVIEAGTASSISGSTILRNRYVGDDYTCNFGAMQSSGAAMIGYAVAPKNGSAGFVSSADNSNFARAALEISDDLKYSTATSQTTTVGDDVTLDTKFIVKNDGRVGIGTSSPDARLETSFSQSGEGQGILINNLNNVNGDFSSLYFGHHTNGHKAGIGFEKTGDYGRGELVFAINNTQANQNVSFSSNEVMRIDSTGNVEVSTGNLVIGTAGKGIDFSANSHFGGTGGGTGMSSELLNSYEEGSFTPYLLGATTAGSFTYSLQLGRYTKVGNMVQFQITLATSATATAPVGDITIRGLPFTSKSTASVFGSASIGWTQNITGGADLGAYVINNNTYIALRNITDGSGSMLQGSAVGSTFYFLVTGTYQT